MSIGKRLKKIQILKGTWVPKEKHYKKSVPKFQEKREPTIDEIAEMIGLKDKEEKWIKKLY